MRVASRSSTRRLLDIAIASTGLIVTAPLLLVAAAGIKLSSPGPVLYPAPRIGRDRRSEVEGRSSAYSPERRQPRYRGRAFTMYKFRTMHVSAAPGSPITADRDSRVFRFGNWLRATKIDELPQLINVLKGDMALVGPRPEAPEIVQHHYTPDDIGTLRVPPGLTSPGAIYYYTHGEHLLKGDVMQVYVERLLPAKLAIDRVYVRRASVLYDLNVLLRTMRVIGARMLGIQRLPNTPELTEADRDPSWPAARTTRSQ